MNLYYRRLKHFVPTLNEKAHTLDDFWQIAQNCGNLSVQNIDLEKLLDRKKKGFYVSVLRPKKDFIFLHDKLAYWQKTLAAFHELCNYFLIYHCDFLKRKQHIAARSLALVMLIPEKDLPELVRNYDSFDKYYKAIIRARLMVLEKRGY